MRDVQRDNEGDLRCPNCGARGAFRSKRSFAAKALLIPTVGIGTLAAPRRLKCLSCGELLRAGHAQAVRSPDNQPPTTEYAKPAGPFVGGGELVLLGASDSEAVVAALGRVTRMQLKDRRTAVRRSQGGSSVRVQVRDDMRVTSAAQILTSAGARVHLP